MTNPDEDATADPDRDDDVLALIAITLDEDLELSATLTPLQTCSPLVLAEILQTLVDHLRGDEEPRQ